MELIQDHWLLISILVVVGYIVWVVSGVIEASVDIKNRPREKMFWCHTHGPFRYKHVLPVPGMTDVCPICYREAWIKAGKS